MTLLVWKFSLWLVLKMKADVFDQDQVSSAGFGVFIVGKITRTGGRFESVWIKLFSRHTLRVTHHWHQFRDLREWKIP